MSTYFAVESVSYALLASGICFGSFFVLL